MFTCAVYVCLPSVRRSVCRTISILQYLAFSLSVSQSVCLSVGLSVGLYDRLFLPLSVCRTICIVQHLTISQSACRTMHFTISNRLPVCLSAVSLSDYLHLTKSGHLPTCCLSVCLSLPLLVTHLDLTAPWHNCLYVTAQYTSSVPDSVPSHTVLPTLHATRIQAFPTVNSYAGERKSRTLERSR